MKQPIIVTAAIIKKDNLYLLAKRPNDGRHNQDRWEFPGGKIEYGEEPRTCLKREIKEELGIDIEVKNIFDYSSFIYKDQNNEDKHILILAFECVALTKNIKLHDIEDFIWATPNEFDKLDITEADLKLIEKLKENINKN